MKNLFLTIIIGVILAACSKSSDSSGPSGNRLDEIAKKRGLTPADMEAALKTFTPSGKHDPLTMFASGGHAGNVLVIGIPSMRILKRIPVFSPDSWTGYASGSKDTTSLMKSGRELTWGDVHHPALSETDGQYDGQFLFVNDKANARVAVIDLKDFVTKQILNNPLFVNNHGGTFVTPNTEWVVETSQYNVPLGNEYSALENFKNKYKGVVTFWKFDREKGRIDQAKSFSLELPPYWQDIADFGKLGSDGLFFVNSINTEQSTGGNLEGKPDYEVGVSRNDMDYLHVVDWKKAAEYVAKNKVPEKLGMKLVTLENVIKQGLLHFIHEPKSPHGVDISPDGRFAIVSGKLDPHVTVYNLDKVREAIKNKTFSGKDPYGVPILKFDSVVDAQVEVGLGPLHTQFDAQGNAYTSLFLDSAIAKWSLQGEFYQDKKAWKLMDKVQVHYNIGHLSCVQGDTVAPGGGHCVAMNKWSIDRFNKVGPLLPQNFQLVDISGEKMKVIYDLPIPGSEPHYAQIIPTSILKPIEVYEAGTDPFTMEESPFATFAGEEKIVRKGNTVEVFMTVMRSHIVPDKIEVNKGDLVRIHVTNIEQSFDATHGFAISGLNINLSLEPGKVDTVEFKATKSGTYPFYCTEFCSALHLEMAGYLLVK